MANPENTLDEVVAAQETEPPEAHLKLVSPEVQAELDEEEQEFQINQFFAVPAITSRGALKIFRFEVPTWKVSKTNTTARR